MYPDINTLRDHIQKTILNNADQPIAADQDLLLSGLLDSLSVIRLIAWLESQCQLKIPPEDVLVEHFGSLNQIMDYLKTRQLLAETQP